MNLPVNSRALCQLRYGGSWPDKSTGPPVPPRDRVYGPWIRGTSLIEQNSRSHLHRGAGWIRRRTRERTMRGKLIFITGVGVGYVLGTRAGRERFDQMVAQARKFWESPTVQEAAGLVQAQAA